MSKARSLHNDRRSRLNVRYAPGQAVEKAACQEASGTPGRETEGTAELQGHQAVGTADRQHRQAEGKERVAFRLGRPCQGEGRAACLDRHQGELRDD